MWPLTELLIVTALAILGQSGANDQDGVMKCSLTNLRCDTPFEYGGKMHDTCITDGVNNGRAWCPLKVRKDGSANLQYCMECWGDQRCYYTGDSFPDNSWGMTCPPGCIYVQKNSYGTDNEFSAASYVCATAIHEGLIKNSTGGDVMLTKQKWKKPFVGEAKNGIKTYPAKMENNPMMRFQKSFPFSSTPHIIFSQKDTTISSLQSGSVDATSILTNQKLASGVACDVRKKKIFWSDVGAKSIFSATFDGNVVSDRKKIFQGDQVQKPEMLGIDWVHGNLYWSDRAAHSVSVSNTNGQHVVTMIERKDFEPTGLAVDPKNGQFYIADSGQNPKIEKCSMAERDSCHIVVKENLVSPVGLSIDIKLNALCWTDSEIPQISCTGLDGTNRQNMKFSEQRLKQPFAIALFNTRVYWTDLSETIVASADSSTWNSLHIHLGDITKARGLAIFDIKAQPASRNRCINAPCKQICVPTVNSYVCLCQDGEYPQGDGSCGSKPLSLQLFVAETTSIKRYTINPDTSSLLSTKTVLTDLEKAAAVSIDTLKKTIYWSDTKAKTIDMSPLSDNLNLGKRNFLNAGDGYVSSVEGIAIDSKTRLFYWTDVDLHGVYVTNLDPVQGEHHVAALIEGDKFYKPRGIALDPKHGYIYVVDSNSPYKIQQCESKGHKTCRNLIQNALNLPNWITIDDTTQRLYFTNFNGEKISSSDFDGEDRKKLGSGFKRPYGIVVHKNKVYYSDHTSRSILSVDKTTGSKRTTIAKSDNIPMGLFLFDPRKSDSDTASNVCDRSKCRYICVPTRRTAGSGPYCLCPKLLKGKSDAKECACDSGYEPSPVAGQGCTDIDECTKQLNYGGCLIKANCMNTPGGYFCNCGKGYKTAADKKSCIKLSACASNPCKNDGSCQQNSDKSDYTCACLEGFTGKNCENFDAKLSQWEDDTGAINLECNAPAEGKKEIIWMHNRIVIDGAESWLFLMDGERKLVIQSPHYLYSGLFSCQFSYGGIERIAYVTVKIKALPKLACGESPFREELGDQNRAKIFGGTATKIGNAPFLAMLYKTVRHSYMRKGAFCGGSLVNNKYVVTAAHCFHRVSQKDTVVYFGKLTTDTEKEERYQQSSEIEKIIQHPQHNPMDLHADIAILVLKKEIYFSAGVKPICVPAPDDESEDVKARPWKNGNKKYGIVYGWGITEKEQYSDRLLEVILPVVKQGICRKAYSAGEITNTMFCLGGEGIKDACSGDSGGPFTLYNKKKRKWFLGGIVSWGKQCGVSDKPGVYTRIGTDMRQWIYNNAELSLNA